MKKITFILMFLTPMVFIFGQVDQPKTPAHEFVGTHTCGMCHKTEKQGKQLVIWQNSKHAKAYELLKTDEANKIAKEKGFDKPAVEVEDCLKCHASGYNVDAKLLGAKFKVSDGVQCETCHGPGGDYKSIKVMKNKDEAIKKGLVLYTNPKELCVKCHNAQSPTNKPFDFDKAWAQIKHTVPEK